MFAFCVYKYMEISEFFSGSHSSDNLNWTGKKQLK